MTLLFGFLGQSTIANSEASPSATPEVSSSNVPCSLAAPGNLTAALTCADKALAMRELDEFPCVPGNWQAVTEVRRVWFARESLPADAAARDSIIQAFMAICIVEANQTLASQDSAELSAIAYLRQSLTDRNPTVVAAAMTGIGFVLTKEDVDTVVRIASMRANLAIPAMAGLSISCIPEAKAGVTAIRAAYTGSPQAAEIDQFVEQLKDHCSGIDHSMPPTFVGQVILSPPVRQDEPPAPEAGREWGHAHILETLAPEYAAHIRDALASPDPSSVRQQLSKAFCSSEHTDVVTEMRRAWEARNSPGASATMRDPRIQVIVARCIVQADYPANLSDPDLADALGLLRQAIRSDDIGVMIDAVSGLAIIGADEDSQSIVEVVHRVPSSLNGVVMFLGYQCGASNLKTIAAIREGESTRERREQLDAVYSRIAPVREQTCGEGK